VRSLLRQTWTGSLSLLCLVALVLLVIVPFHSHFAWAQTPQITLPSPGQISITLTPLTNQYVSVVSLRAAGQPVPGADVRFSRIHETVYVDVYQVPLTIWLNLTPQNVLVTVSGQVYVTVYVDIPGPPPVVPPVLPPPVVGPPTFETPAATVTVDPATRTATVRVLTDRVQVFIQTQPHVPVLVVDIPPEADALAGRFVFPTAGLRALADARRTLELRGPSFSLRVSPATFLASLPEEARLAPDLALAGAPLTPQQVSAVLAEAPEFLEGLVHAGPMVDLDLGVETAPAGLPLTQYPLVLGLPFDRDALGDVSPLKLGVYRRDELTGGWHFVGGQVDVEAGVVYARLPSLSTYTVMAYDKTFADVIGHWSQADVEVMASKHMVRGMTAATFAPDARITRAQFTTLLVRALRLGEFLSPAATFSDVRPGDWHYGYVEAAARAGLVMGYPDGTFRPDAPVTRQEMAALVVRAARAAGREVVITPAQELRALFRFLDRDAIAEWALGAAARAAHIGIITGRTPVEYAPAADATRAEGTVMLLRLLRYLEEL